MDASSAAQTRCHTHPGGKMETHSLSRVPGCKLSESALAQIIQRNWSEVNRRIAQSVEGYYTAAHN